MKKVSESRLIKSALRDAIRWRESYMDSLGHSSHPSDVEAYEYSQNLRDSYAEELRYITRNDVEIPEIKWSTVPVFGPKETPNKLSD